MLQAAWEIIRKKKIPALIITKIIISIYMRSRKVSVMETPLQKKKSIKKIQENAKELSKLVEATGLEGFLALDFRQWLDDDTLRHSLAIQMGIQMLPSPTRDYRPPKMSYLLRQLSEQADKYYNRQSILISDENVTMGKINDEFASRNYFIRDLTKKMIQLEGEKNAVLVACITDVLFHDGTEIVDDKKVHQATKNIKVDILHNGFKESIKKSLEIKELERAMGYADPFDGF